MVQLLPVRPGRKARLTALSTAAALIASLGLAATVTTTSASAAAPPTPSGWTPVWIDDFNGPAGSAPDPSKWGYDVGGHGYGNAELQNYTNRPENVSLDGAGNLVITARKENYGSCWYGLCTHTSGRILTANKFTQTYGRIEARLQVPAGRGLWPAFWTLGQDIFTAGWPNSGEIDIMEILGHETNKTYGTLHGPGYSGGGSIGASYTLPSGNFSQGFHTFTVDWSPNLIKWYVDGVLFSQKTPADLNGNPWVFDKPHFILLNLAVGGQWPGSPDASTAFPARYVVDYVAVYEAGGTTPPPPPPPGGTNIAQGKTATASSSLGGNTPGAAVDGNAGTRWESVHGVDPSWVQVDLGETYNLTNVNLNWEGAFARGYQVQVSNSATGPWTTIYSTTTGDGGADNLAVTGSGRYLRINGTQRGTPYGYSLWEINVQGTPGTTPPTTSTNLSQGKPTTASSSENTGTAAGNATDGNAGTRWSSAFSDPQWLQVDLGATRNINRVVLNWEAAYGRAFQIQTSNSPTGPWTNIYSTTTGTGGVQTLDVSGSGRYVRVNGTTRGTGYGYSLWEFQVFGS